MRNSENIENWIGRILLIGMLLSICLVSMGGVAYLIQHGSENMQLTLLQTDVYETSVKQIWESAFSLTPFGLINLGLLLLAMTQIVRVALLACYYVSIKDNWFILISVFILFVLCYSLFWR